MSDSFVRHQQQYPLQAQSWKDKFSALLHKLLAGTAVNPAWLHPELQKGVNPQPKTGQLHLEIVSHCWQYSHFLRYQLSSIALNPPHNLQVTMTVYYCPEDSDTARLLEFFASKKIKNVTWNWQELPPPYLFRRAIGRNLAARDSKADWVWFTDCDETFQRGCLDSLATLLHGRIDPLVYPAIEYKTAALSDEDLEIDNGKVSQQELREVELDSFSANRITRATGPLQITHGDVARAYGYCDTVACYQKPADSWCKAHEDRVFRWLLGSQGVAIDLPGVYRIQHQSKGRQQSGSLMTSLRLRLRRWRYDANARRDQT